MANNFVNAGSCLAVYNLENGALLVDSKGSNDLTNGGAVVNNTFNYKQGLASAYGNGTFRQSFLYLPDAVLPSNFPHKYGTTNYNFSVTGWVKQTAENKASAYRMAFQKYWGAWNIWTGLALRPSVQFRVALTGLSGFGTSHVYGVLLNEWYFFGATFDYDYSSTHMRVRHRIWRDSIASWVSEDSDTASKLSYGTPRLDTRNWVVVGGADISFDFSRTLIGYFDEYTLWNRAITDDEITEIKNQTYLNLPPTDPTIFFFPSSMSSALLYRPIVDPPKWPMEETLEWKSNILRPDYTNDEQRIALRVQPRQIFNETLQPTTQRRRARMNSLVHSRIKQKLGIPVWQEAVKHSTPLNSGSSSITVDTRYSDFRDDTYGLLWASDTEYEILRINVVSDNSLSLSVNVQNNYTGVKWIMPMRFGYVNAPLVRTPRLSEDAFVTLSLQIIDTTELTGYSASQTYDGYEVVDRPHVVNGELEPDESHDADVQWLDNETGLVGVQSNTENNVVTQSHRFRYDTAADCWDFKEWLYDKYGKQKAFLSPTDSKDLIVSRPVGSSDSTIYVENVDFAKYIGANDLLQYLGFRTPAGTLVVRKIDAAAYVSDSEESITFTTTAGTAFLVNTSVHFVHRCRLGSDRVSITWLEPNTLVCNLPVVRITQ